MMVRRRRIYISAERETMSRLRRDGASARQVTGLFRMQDNVNGSWALEMKF